MAGLESMAGEALAKTVSLGMTGSFRYFISVSRAA